MGAEKTDRAKTITARLRAMDRSDDTWIIDVENCTAFIDAHDEIERYFDALASQGEDQAFLSKVAVSSGFVAPLHLLTGLIDAYSEDWRPIIDGYGRTILQPGDPFGNRPTRMIQTVIFDCWLLWGPSIPLCTCDKWYGNVALQYGYGDEANSLALHCLSADVLRVISGSQEYRIAVQARVQATLKWGPSLSPREREVCPAQDDIWRRHRLVLEIADDKGIWRPGGTEEQVSGRYYSAYLWIILVMCDAAEQPFHPDEPWRDIIPFFEHGNIAEPATLEFHKSQLAQKAVAGALELLEHNEGPDFVLRFACAIDESGCGCELLYPAPRGSTIREKMGEQIKGPTESSQIILDSGRERPWKDGDYSSCALPAIVNSYLTIEEDAVEFRELRWTRKADRDLLETFYRDHYVSEFPDPDEVESLENIEDYLRLKENGWYKTNNYHVIVALEGDEVVGGSIFDYFTDPNAGVIEFLFVSPSKRGTGLGRRLLEKTEQVLESDADKSRGLPLDWIVGEVDDPYAPGTLANGFDPFARVRVWHRWGYRMLDFPYVQPALAVDKSPVASLLLVVKTTPHGQFHDSSLPAEVVNDMLRNYLKWAMRIDPPDEDLQFRKMSRVATRKKCIELRSLGEYVGWDRPAGLVIKEVVNEKDKAFSDVVGIYEDLFTDPKTAIPSSDFCAALSGQHGLYHTGGYRYHLWKIHSEAKPNSLGMASFLTMPSAGFGGYIGLKEALRKSGYLPLIIAQIEERMVRDGKRRVDEDPLHGWYIECEQDKVRDRFLALGFHDLNVPYMQPERESGTQKIPPIKLHLLYKPFGRLYNTWPRVTIAELLQAVREIYGSIYGIDRLEENSTFNAFEKWANDPGTLWLPGKATDLVAEARQLAEQLVSPLGQRWLHVQAVAACADELRAAVPAEAGDCLVAAAWLHDIGYSPEVRDTGLHSLDGASYLRNHGWPAVIVDLVAHHSGARFEADERGLRKQLAEYPFRDGPLLDALVTADLTRGRAGEPLTYDERISEILDRYTADDPMHRAWLSARPELVRSIQRTEQRRASRPT